MASSAVVSPLQLSPRVVASRKNGAKGGQATAAKYGKQFFKSRAESGGRTVLTRYGVDYFKHIRSRRKTWAKKLKRRKNESNGSI